ncbi:putative C6 transcription factor [Talaromyces proteolyticus]|uniref:C6 transcription factor n=1 Tax=Talaromyces proteolyticus TaxID=1131652 RepID=A0AAD4KGJ9_9EURO|nr:putative C6 transcription factor [Talaromyces proteolyticus]KAH8690603.1 putative C6 transcription factor [Talaromyces proteolyticus]
MSMTAKSAPSMRSKKACTECRQQKAKCDAYLTPNEPCTRCRKVGAQCVISEPFKREHKRKRLSELQHETEELRKKLVSGRINTLASPIAVLTTAAEMSRTPESLRVSTPSGSPPQPTTRLERSRIVPANIRPVPVLSAELPMVEGETQARTLNGITVEAEEINDLFQLFFRDFAPFLSILDPTTSPNSYYAQSSLLFWTVLVVSSRSYSKNPTLFAALTQPVTDLILLSMSSNASPVAKIQSLILMLTWPFPKVEVLFPLSGMMLHFAMQNGLHIPVASHEFARNHEKSKHKTSVDTQRRTELWAQCVVVYQRTCLQKGQPPRAMLDLVPESGAKLCQQLPPVLTVQLKCLDIASKCSVAVFSTGVRNPSLEHERSLNVLLRTFENQLKDLEDSFPATTNTLYTTIARLQIQVFHLYKDLSAPHDGCFTMLAKTACSVIDHAKIIFDRPELHPACPMYIMNILVIACSCLVRMLKSVVARDLDVEQSKSCLFTGINLLNCFSIDPQDFAAKCSTVVNQLYHSRKAFRRPDGTEHSTLRIRSRLVMSPTIDLVWWWRDEFDSEGKDEEDSANRGDVDPSPADAFNIGSEFGFLDNEFLTDFEWAMSSDYLLPPEPYANIEWTTTPGILPPS